MSTLLRRAMVVNAAQLATYSQAKELILGTGYVKVCVKMNLNFTHGARGVPRILPGGMHIFG
jgi:hypothetical protein